MKTYSVYRLTSPEGKTYVGMTSRLPKNRWRSGYRHNPFMMETIAKYGWPNIVKNIEATGLSKEEAERLEARLVDEYQSTDRRYGYNINRGGSGRGIVSERTRKIQAEHMLGDKNPTRRFGHPMLGKKHTDESKAKMSASAKARVGRVVTAETRQRLRLVQEKTPVRCVETGVVYDGVRIAAESVGVSASKISAVCHGRRKTTGGYQWEYVLKER